MTKRKQYKLEREILNTFIPQWVKNITMKGKAEKDFSNDEEEYKQGREW